MTNAIEGELLPRAVEVALAPHPLRHDLHRVQVLHGASLAEMGAGDCVLAFINGDLRDDLDYIPSVDDSVLLKVVPQDGDALRVVASIAVVVVASVLTGPGGALAGGAFGLSNTATFAALTLVGQLAVNALIPPTGLNLDRPSALSPFRGIQRTSNRVAPYEVVPRLFGTDILFPAYAALPVPISVGGQQDFLGLFCLGYRDLIVNVGTLKLGETPLANFVGSEYRIWDFNRNEALDEVFQFGAVTDSANGDLRNQGALVARTTPPNTERVEVEVGGLIGFFGDEKKDEVLSLFRIQYRAAGTADPYARGQPQYVAGDGGVTPIFPANVNSNGFDANSYFLDQPFFEDVAYVRGSGADPRTNTVTVAIDLPSTGQWDIRIERLPGARFRGGQIIIGPPEQRAPHVDYSAADSPNGKFKQEITLIRLRSIVEVLDIEDFADPRFAYVALRLQASDQLSGTVDDFNCIATGVVPVWNGSAWVKQASNNPAFAFRDAFLGPAVGRNIDAGRLDDAAIIDWASACDAETPPREFNGVFDGVTSLFEAARSIAAAGRASLSTRDGKFSVVRDTPDLAAVQTFTPRNHWDFSVSRSYSRLPHALKVKFRDRDGGYVESERIVYADGYSLDGAGGTLVATEFEQLPLFGCTHKDQAYKDGRYHQAVAKLRPEKFTWSAQVDHLVCQRGDVVRLQHDAMLVGLGSGRITEIGDGDTGPITIDERISIEAGKSYQARVRIDTGQLLLLNLSNAPGDSYALHVTGGVPASVKVGDLVSMGESGLIDQLVLITDIRPQPDMAAQISAVPYSAPDVHQSESGPIPPYDPLVTRPQRRPPEPVILNIDSSAEVARRNNDGSFDTRVIISYAFAESDEPVRRVEAQYRASGGPVNWHQGPRQRNNGTLEIDVADDSIEIDIRIRGEGANGLAGPWAYQFNYTLETARVAGDPSITLLEQTNNPATPNRDLSTVIATVAEPDPPDTSYSHALVEYRTLDAASWTLIGPTDANGQARVVLNSDGETYEFRARTVNNSGVVASFGATAQITLSIADGEVPQTDPDAGSGANSGLDVLNLRIRGQTALQTQFTGAGLPVQWNAVVPAAGQTLRDYRVRVIDPTSGAVLRVRYIGGTNYLYDYADNVGDSIRAGYTSPLRQITIEVSARTREGEISENPALNTFQNPAPSLPGDFTHGTVDNTLILNFTRPADGDYVKAQVFVSTVSGFTAGPANLMYDGAETKPITIAGLAYATTYYYRVQLFDQFGAGTLSIQYSSTTGDIPGTDTIPPSVPGVPVLTSSVESAELYTRSSLTISWAASSDANPFFYELEIWRTSAPTQITRARTAEPNYTLSPAQAGVNYSARVRAINYGTSAPASAFSATASHTVAGDLTPPANVTGATATGGLDKVVVEWTNPTAPDFLTVLVYRGTTAGFTANAASLQTETRGTTFVDADVVNGTAYYYKFATRDVSGNTSAVSAAIGPATPNTINGTNVAQYISDAAIKAAQIGAQFGGGNVLLNSSFEVDSDSDGKADDWTVVIGGSGGSFSSVDYSLSAPIDPAHFGAFEQRIAVFDFVGTAQFVDVRQVVPWSPGLAGVLSCYASSNNGATLVQYVQYLDAADAVLSTESVGYIATGARVRLSMKTAAAPAGTAKARVYSVRLFASATPTSRFLRVDNVQFEAGDVLTAYAPRPDEILAGSIQEQQINNAAITEAKLAANAVTETKIANDSISTPKIIAGAVQANSIAAGAVVAGKIAANAISATELQADSVTAIKILAGAIVAGKIAANAISATEIQANAITSDRLTVGDFSNLLDNPNFELGDIGWTPLNAGVEIINNAASAFSGNWFLRFTGSGHAQYNAISRLIPVSVGDQFFISARARFNATADGTLLRIVAQFIDASGATINNQFSSQITPGATAWTLISGTVTAPAGATQVRFYPQWLGTPTQGLALIDECQMIRVSGSALIADAAIITAKINDLAVTTAKIDSLAVTNAKINDLDAVKITAGFIAAARIQAATITADKLNVTTLSAISADMGSVTAGTITSAVIRTAASGERLQFGLTGLAAFNSGGSVTSWIKNDGSGYLGLSPGAIQWTTAGAVSIPGNLTISGNLQMTAGSIYGGKASYASTVAGYWLGFDGGAPKFHIGNSTDNLKWDGTSLIANNIKTASSGQRVVLTAGNEAEFYDNYGSLAVTIGINTSEAVQGVFLSAGLPHSGTSVGNVTQQNRIGVKGYSVTAAGVYGRSISGPGVTAVSGATALAAVGLTAAELTQTDNTAGGSFRLKSASDITTAPTHAAKAGTVCIRNVSGLMRPYIQTAGGFDGSGSTWYLVVLS